jgi:RNA polymerase sigma-70 factor (ECF subfamily)
MGGDARRAAERSARDHYGRLLSILAARSRDITSAEDALADALAAALRDWPVNGVPRSPEAWLLAVARRRLIDTARRRINAETALEQIGWLSEGPAQPDADGFADERLKLLFVCAHPAIDVAVRAPLMLQVVLGFSAEEIAPFFLTPPATISQRLVRAKRKLREAGAAFQVPGEDEFPERLEAVLGAIYALFTQGWSLPVVERDRRRALASDAVWLARLTVSLCPDQPEARGLLALVLHAWARDGARRGADGRYVPLPEQDMAAWDSGMIDEAERAIELAARQRRPGRFQIEAAIQSVHAVRRLTGTTDWRAILGFYDAIIAGSDSPVPAINRCIAVMHVHGPEPALADLEVLAPDRRLDGYQPYWAARGLDGYQPYWAARAEILSQTGDKAAAAAAYDRAIALEEDPAVAAFLAERKAALGGQA